ncbi:MAG: acetyl-CoA carboxylase biotin carboxylase subunit [Geminicoccaceae bacterium]|nr:MAG: acetyl-CoA carboxylase biotin carboxylase subunit [Geminicoccaceae bacterium]
MAIRTLLVANRGEIALRIQRAARELGIRVVQAHSAADRDSLPVRLADAAIEIGPPPAKKSYLAIPAIVEAATKVGADAVHPGYGFLAENGEFADACEVAGLVFVGPTGDTIRAMGDKVEARRLAAEAGVPTVPGSAGRIHELDEAREVLARTGFPVMIKAAAGGGGRGIRIARDEEELARLWPQARAEALAAFGDGGLYLEKRIERARHLEVQVLGDGQRVIHLFERDCSLQRRRQKLWEEAPAVRLDPAVRERLCAAAVRLAERVHYRGAGTVEFLFDEATGDFYFLEMNTRIQVEHPVTEEITGIDLVKAMLEIAGGAPLPFRQEEIAPRGHAIEVRINAEDPARDFAPHPGRIASLELPGGPGVRIDTALYAGYEVPPFYDSLLMKLIARGRDREEALARLERALAELAIGGIPTTAALHRALVRTPEVRAWDVHTAWLEPWLDTNRRLLA